MRDVTLPSLLDYQAANFVILTRRGVQPARALDARAVQRLRRAAARPHGLGAVLAATDYVQALRYRRELCAATAEAAADVDILLTAGAPGEAPRIDAVPKWEGVAQPGLHRADEPDRLARDRRLLGLRRERAAGGDPDHRQAVPGGRPVPRGARVRAGRRPRASGAPSASNGRNGGREAAVYRLSTFAVHLGAARRSACRMHEAG